MNKQGGKEIITRMIAKEIVVILIKPRQLSKAEEKQGREEE